MTVNKIALSFVFFLFFIGSAVFSQDLDCTALGLNDLKDLSQFKTCNQKSKTDLAARKEFIRVAFRNPELVSLEQQYTRSATEKLFRLELLRLNRIPDIKPRDIAYAKAMIKFVAEQKLKDLFFALVGFLGNPVGELRDAAGIGIAKLEDDRIYPILANMLGAADPLERTYAVQTIYHLKDERTFTFLTSALEDVEESIRYHAIQSLLELNDPQSISIFIDLLENDPEIEVKIKSAQALGKIRNGSGYNALTKMITHSSVNLRKQVILSMISFNKVRSALVFSQRLPDEESNELKIQMIKSMLSLKNSGGGRGLRALLKKENNIEVLQWSIYAAGQLRTRAALNELMEITGHKNPAIRAEAAMALKKLRAPRSVSTLLDLLEDENESYQVRYSALLAIAEIDEPGAYPALLNISIKTQNKFLKIKIQDAFQQLLDGRYGRRLNR